MIRTSERKTFKRCPWRWYQLYRMGLVSKGRPADALWFGIGVHEALAQWYKPGLKRGIHPAEYWADWAAEEETKIRTSVSENYQEDVWEDARDLGIAMLEGYVATYGEDDTWEVIDTEHAFQIEIPYRNRSGVQAIYAGTFDGVYRDLTDGLIRLMEHKTAKSVKLSHLPLDDQAGSYWAVASDILRHEGILKSGEQIKGIMYNFLRKAMPDERPQDERGRYLNKNGSVSKIQPKSLFVREPVDRTRKEIRTQIRRIQDEASWMAAARKRPDRIFKNPTMDCDWDCPLYDMCQLHERGGDDWKEYRDVMFTRADPYADHRKSA